MFLKNFLVIFSFLFLSILFIGLASADVSFNNPVLLNGSITLNINYNSYSPFVYFYDYSNNLVDTVDLGCASSGSSCRNFGSFSVHLDSDNFPLGVYHFTFYSPSVGSSGSWITKTFEVSQYSSSTTCSDGTQAGQCSSTKPLDCLASSSTGNALGLVNDCSLCGCPSGETCQSDGSCLATGAAQNSSNATSPIHVSAPEVKLIIPHGFLNSLSQEFYSYVDSLAAGVTIQNATLYVWNSNGSLTHTKTKIVGNVSNTYLTFDSIGYIFPRDGNYSWNLYVCNNQGSCAFSPNNASFAIDTTPPQLSLSNPTTPPGMNYQDYIEVNVSVKDKNPGVVYVNLSNDTSFVESQEINNSPYFANFTNLPSGNYHLTIVAYDKAGNFNNTQINDVGLSSIPPFGPNKKDMQLYSSKQVFLMSDNNWTDVLPMVSATIWTDSSGTVHKYPDLIWHNDFNGFAFDVSSDISFMQQYFPSELTIVGNTPSGIDSLLVASPPLGAGLQENRIQRIKPLDYINYWKSFNSVVYVQDNYTLALLASTYASLINAPLVIKGSSLDNAGVFSGREVICVGDVSPAGSSCSESYNLQQLRDKYKSETNTKKVIFVNPSDFGNIAVELYSPSGSPEGINGFCPDNLLNCIYSGYSKTSLVSPFLASAKHELIISFNDPWDINSSSGTYDYLGESSYTDLNSRFYSTSYKQAYEQIGNVIRSNLGGMSYLTIMASPYAVPIFKPYSVSDLVYSDTFGPFAGVSLDASYYSDTNGNGKPNVAVGRIAGISTSDVSSYVARDLFLSSFPKTDNVKLLGSSFGGFLGTMVNNMNYYFKSAGYNSVNVSSSETAHNFNPDEWKNQGLIFYADHGAAFWAGIFANNVLAESYYGSGNPVWGSYNTGIPVLDNSLVIADACDTVSSQDGNSVWANVIRKGGIGFLGGVSTTGLGTSNIDFMNYVYYNNYSLGNAFKDSYVPGTLQGAFTLIGDPTININPPHKLKQKISLINTVLCQPTGNLCGLGILNCCAGEKCSWFTCHQCLPASTTVNLLNQNQCCLGWHWVTKQKARFCAWHVKTGTEQKPNLCGWCSNGASKCWPWQWRVGWDAAHCGTHTKTIYANGIGWNGQYCGYKTVNDHKECT